MSRSALSGCLTLLLALPPTGCGSKSKTGVEGDPPKTAAAQVDPPTPVAAGAKKPRPAKPGKAAGAAAGTDPDLMDTEQRFKALVGRIRPGMTTAQVAAVLGTPDETDEKDLGEFNPQKQGQILEIWKWTDSEDEKKFIMLSFVDGKLRDGGTPGYDIRKGFKSK